MVDACHDTFVQTHGMYATKSEPNANDELGVMMTCHCRFASCDKCATLVGDVITGSLCTGGGQERV